LNKTQDFSFEKEYHNINRNLKAQSTHTQLTKQKGLGHIFKVIDRFRRDKILSPREQSPPVGNYTPKYELLEETLFAPKFKNENSPRSTFLGVRVDTALTNREIKCSKFPK